MHGTNMKIPNLWFFRRTS